jgi:hypothetical protein
VASRSADDASAFTTHSIHPAMTTLGLRDVEDIPTLLTFAQFANDASTLADLRAHLEARAQAFLAKALLDKDPVS